MKLTIISIGPIGLHPDGHYGVLAPFGAYVDRLARHFDRITICAEVYLPDNPRFAALCDYTIRASNVTYIEHPGLGRRDSSMVRTFLKYLRKLPVLKQILRVSEALYLYVPNYPSYLILGLSQLMRLQIPAIVYMAGDAQAVALLEFRWGGWRRGILRRMYVQAHYLLQRWAVCRVPIVLAHQGALYEKAVQWRGSYAGIYQAVPMLNVLPEDSYLRSDYALSSPARLLYVGPLLPGKGICYLIEAMCDLRARGYNIALEIAGVGPQQSELTSLVQQLGLAEVVTFVGYVTNGPLLWEKYRTADIFVLPTLSEGFPRVLYEAASQSLPIISTCVGGIPHFLQDGEHALLVEPGRSDELAKAISRLLESNALRSYLAGNAYPLVQGVISQDPGRQLVSLFSSLF